MISAEAQQKLVAAIVQVGTDVQGLVRDDKHADILGAALARVTRSLRWADVGVAVPCAPGRSVVEETLTCVSNLAFNYGMAPAAAQSFEIANNRESLLDGFIAAGFRRLLFLDSDTVVEPRGVEQLMSTMDRWRSAMVAALVPQRFTGGQGEYNAFLRNGAGGVDVVKKEHLPASLTAFPVNSCGLACALLDLEQIKEKPGPRFRRIAEGHKHYGEDIAFCDWLRKNELDFVVDPKVATLHCVNHRFAYVPQETT